MSSNSSLGITTPHFPPQNSPMIFPTCNCHYKENALARGVAKGGIWGSEPPPPLAQIFFVIFTKTLTRRRTGTNPQRFRTLKTPSFENFWRQNPLLRPFLATPLALATRYLEHFQLCNLDRSALLAQPA